MRLQRLIPFVLAASFATPLAAQIAPGHALVCWKPQNPTVPGGLRVVDRAGAVATVTGLTPQTVGTTRWDGAQSIVVRDGGVAVAGLGVDNRTGASPLPLDLRSILIVGSLAVTDTRFATVMQVPAGEQWMVTDIKERRDRSLLVGATQVLATANPMPRTEMFLVDTTGAVTVLPNAGFPLGSLLAVADAGQYYLGAFQQQFFVTNTEVWAFGYQGSPAPFRVCQFVNTSAFGGMDMDVDGELVAGVPFAGSTIVRVPIVANATPIPLPSTPPSVAVCDILPAAGLAALFTAPTLIAGSLNAVDTLAGGFTQWAATVVRDPVDVSVHADPIAYGEPTITGNAVPYLGSQGGFPRLGNSAFALRIGGTPNAPGVVYGSAGRASVPTPFGTLLLFPGALFPIGNLVLSAGGTAILPLPLPGHPSVAGARVDLQSVALSSLTPPMVELSQGLELIVLTN